MITNNKSYNNYLYFFLVILIFFLINIFRLTFEYYNLEWYFTEYAKNIYDYNYYFTKEIFRENQANTSFYSILISFFYFIGFDDDNLKIILRLLNSFFLFLMLFFFFKKKYYFDITNYNFKLFVIILLLVCPFIYVYNFRIYPEIISFSLILISFFLLEKKFYQLFFSAIFCSIAFLVKPVILILAPIFILKIFDIYRKNYYAIFKIAFFYGLLVCFSYFLFFLFFEKSIFSSNYNKIYFNFNLLNSIISYLNYILYISIILFPILLINFYFFINKKNLFYIFFYLFLSIFVTWFFVKFGKNYGEFTLSFLSFFFQFKIFFYFLSICSFFSFFSFFHCTLKNKKTFFLFVAINISLILLSLIIYRPAQRYLIYLIPFVIFLNVFLIKDIFNVKFFKTYFSLVIIFYLLINFFHYFYQRNEQKSFILMKDYLIMNNIISNTHPGYLFHSMGNYFPHHILNRTKKFKFFVKLCDKDSKYIYKVLINSFTNKSLCLINS